MLIATTLSASSCCSFVVSLVNQAHHTASRSLARRARRGSSAEKSFAAQAARIANSRTDEARIEYTVPPDWGLPAVQTQALLPPRYHTGRRETTDAPADDRKGGPEELRGDAGFQLAELRAAHEKHHVHAGHAPAQRVRGLELPDDVADDGADGVGRADAGETQQRERKVSRDAEPHPGAPGRSQR